MYRSLDTTSNLKLDILELKKELSSVRSDNHLLKVKVRKLQTEITKRDHQIEVLLDPRKSTLIRKVISEKGASLIVSLRDRIKKLEKNVSDKDSTIKRLQSDLQTKKLYTKFENKKKHPATNASSKCVSIPYIEKVSDSEDDNDDDIKSSDLNCNSFPILDIFGIQETDKKFINKSSSRRSVSVDRMNSHKHECNNDERAQYERLPRSRLLSIIGNLKSNQQRLSPVRKHSESPESDLERCELQCDTPHPEIQQLQNYFMEILGEVDHLKVTISTLKSEQEKTSSVLKEKNSNIEHLAKQIQTLRKPTDGGKNNRYCFKNHDSQLVKPSSSKQNRCEYM